MSSLIFLETSINLFLIGSLLGLLIGKKSAYLITFIASVFLFITAIQGINGFRGKIVTFIITTAMVDTLSSFFLLILAILSLALSLYLFRYDVKGNFRFISMGTNMALLSAIIFLITNNLESLVMAYELFAISTFIIILTSKLKYSKKVALNYLVMTQIFGIIPLLISVGFAYGVIGNIHYLTFENLRNNINHLPLEGSLLCLLFLSSALMRGGVFPFNIWVPEVYTYTPSPFIPIMVIGEGMSIYLIIRVMFFLLFPNSDLGYFIALLGLVMTFVVLYALKNIPLKRKLIYLSMMDVGISYFAIGSSMVLWGSIFGSIILIGALLHTLYQSVYKSSLFFALGNIESYNEECKVLSFKKLIKYPFVYYSVMISAFSMAGIPPFASFVSRFIIYQGILGYANIVLWVMVLIIAILGIFPIAIIPQMKHEKSSECMDKEECKESYITLSIPSIMGIISLFIGIFPFIFGPWLTKIPQNFGGPYLKYWNYLFLPNKRFFLTFVILGIVNLIGFKVSKTPMIKLDKFLSIFYNINKNLIKFSVSIMKGGKMMYIKYILPVIKVLPRDERSRISDCDEVLDYPVRHIDEAIFMPLISLIGKSAKLYQKQNFDMSTLLSGFAIAIAILIVILGVVA